MPMIYAKPLTREEPEGEATLVEKMGEGRGVEMWMVRFDGDADDDLYCRVIKREDV